MDLKKSFVFFMKKKMNKHKQLISHLQVII